MSTSLSEENEEEAQESQPAAHHPPAPPHESFDVSTTVDPSYIISLIRKLLPVDVKVGEDVVGSGLIHEEPKTACIEENGIRSPEHGGGAEAMESSENYAKGDRPEQSKDDQSQSESTREETWEECGCILWDLAACDDHAQFMVQHFILEVLLANLAVSQSPRITEISLGIIGNLACHELSRKKMASTNGLVREIVRQLLLDDVPCLCEACRVLTLCLQGGEAVVWAEALGDKQILQRVFWIAENALNPQLVEKSLGLLLAVLESQPEASSILLPNMLKLDLSSLLIKLLAFEMDKLKEDRMPERYVVLDLILRTIEALSIIDDYAQEICQSQELLHLVKELIVLPDKFEVASSCVTAAVLMANILTDAANLAFELSQDLNVLQGLFDVLPFASGDTEAQNASWSVIARLLMLARESEMSPSRFHLLVSILVSKLYLLEDEVLICPLDHGEHAIADAYGEKRDARVIVMKRICDVLTRWKFLDDEIKNTSFVEDCCINEDDVDKLLDHCCKASRSDAVQ